MIMELESVDDKRIQTLNYMLIQIKWLRLITRESRGKVLKKETLFGRLFYYLVLKTKNWANGLPTRRDFSKCIKYYLETHTG